MDLRSAFRDCCRWVFCLVLMAGAAVAEPVSTADQEPRHLLIATVDNYLPCSDEASNNYEGLSIDVWRRIAETINRPYTLTTISTFSQAVDAAAYGLVDVIASCHKITPGRLERVEFSVPYTRDSLGMLSRESNRFDLGLVKRLINDTVVRLSLITLLLISGLSALALSVLESNFQGMSGFSGNRSVRFTKAWIMLLLGTGVDKLLHHSQRGHALILLASGIRILFISLLVGTTASLLFITRQPLEASAVTKSYLETVLKEGVAVNAGTKMQDWLFQQISSFNLDTSSYPAVLTVDEKGGLANALQSGEVNHIVSDVSVLNQVLMSLEQPDRYRLTLEMSNKTPQAFIFGDQLEPDLKQSINIALARMNYSGDISKLEQSWNKVRPGFDR